MRQNIITTLKKKKTAKRKRSQKMNDVSFADVYPKLHEIKGPKAKVICINMECRLRRAGCYGYEGCPGFVAKNG